VAVLQTLLLAQEKLRDGALKELGEVGQPMEALSTRLGQAVRHMQEVASQTMVGLQVHQQKLAACRTELARTDKAAALLQSMGIVALQEDQSRDDCDGDSKVSAATTKGGRCQKTRLNGERLATLVHNTKVQRAYARSTLETCVTRRERLIELARNSLEAIAKTVPQIEETVGHDVLGMTAHADSTIISCTIDSTCNESWNPFSLDPMDICKQDVACDDSTLFKRQVSDSTMDTSRISNDSTLDTSRISNDSTLDTSRMSHLDSEASSTNPFEMSNPPEEECANNPFNTDSADVSNMTSQPLESALEESAANPFNDDCPKAADGEHEEHIPDEDAFVQPIGVTLLPKLVDQSTIASTNLPSEEAKRSL